MVLYFLRASDGSLFYLTPKNEYLVGRKNSDILIRDDTSISRKHAVFYVRGSHIVLNDFGSKYKTYVNGMEIKADVDVQVQKGDVIKFGALRSSYTLDSIKIVTTGSALDKTESEKLTKNIDFLKGNVIRNFQENVDYVTTKEIVMTAKVLCAIIEGKPIVTLKYWDDFVERVKHNQSIPLPNDYLPPWGEVTIKQDVSLAYNPNRKTLFKDKVFVFCSSVTENKMKEIVKLAGGTTMSFEKHPFTKNAVAKMVDKYIIINETHTIDDKHVMKLFKDVVEHLKTLGKRTIPLQELAVSIMSCSCEKTCNPDFICVESLIPEKQEMKETQEQIIAPETNCNTNTEMIKEEIIIPATIEADNFVITPPDSTTLKQENDLNKGVKRKNEQNDGLPESKRNNTESLQPEISSKNHDRKMFNEAQKKPSLQISTQVSENNPFASRKTDSGDCKKPLLQNKQTNEVFVNPFAALLVKNSTASTSDDVSLISSQSPFASVKETKKRTNAAKRNIEEVADKSKEIFDIKRPRFLSSTTTSQSNDIRESRSFDVSNVDSSVVQKSKWLSKNTLAEMNKTRKPQEVDPETLEYIKSFENCGAVIKVDESMMRKRPDTMATSQSNDISRSCSFNVSNVDSSVVQKSKWLSKKTLAEKNKTIKPREMDPETLEYIKSFENCGAVIKVDESMMRKHPAIASRTDDGKINFKRFKKVWPKRPQTYIFPDEEYIRIVC